MEDWYHDPAPLPGATPQSDLSGLAARESQPAEIPSHFVTSLSQLRATAPQPQQPQQATPAPSVSKLPDLPAETVRFSALTESMWGYLDHAATLCERIAETGTSEDHAALSAVALRLRAVARPATRAPSARVQDAMDIATELKREGMSWANVAKELNKRGLRTRSGGAWTAANVAQRHRREQQRGEA